MKKIISMLVIVCMTLTMLTACSGSNDAADALKSKYDTTSYETKKDETKKETESEEESATEKATETEDKSTEETKPTETPKPTEKPVETSKPSTGGNSSSGNTQTPSKPAETKPAHTHSYNGNVTTQPTCTTAGVKTYTCSCGASYAESVPATGHSWATRQATRETQVWQEGTTHTVVCCACGATFASKDAYNTHTVDMMLAGDTGNHSCTGTTTTQDEGKYVPGTETYTETYCSVCGTVQ